MAALWDLVWSGRITGDTLAPLRAHARRRARRTARPARRRPRAHGRRGRLPDAAQRAAHRGRALVAAARAGRATPPSARHAQAETLLDRHGVVTRGAVTAERLPGGFAAGLPGAAGLRGERAGAAAATSSRVSGRAQFALPGAVDRLRAMPRRAPDRTDPAEPAGHRRAVVLAATDPANPYGAALPWPAHARARCGHKPGRKAGALVVLVDGRLALYVERGGKTLLSFADDERPAARRRRARARRARRGARPAHRRAGRRHASIGDSPLAAALEAAGFHPTPRGLRLRA